MPNQSLFFKSILIYKKYVIPGTPCIHLTYKPPMCTYNGDCQSRSAGRYLQRRANSSRSPHAFLVTTVFSSWSTSIDLWSIVNARLIERARSHARMHALLSLCLSLFSSLPLSLSLFTYLQDFLLSLRNFYVFSFDALRRQTIRFN